MGKGQSGVKSWMDTCPYCGERYRHTNFMVRYVEGGEVLDFCTQYTNHDRMARAIRTDTHKIACKRKHGK